MFYLCNKKSLEYHELGDNFAQGEVKSNKAFQIYDRFHHNRKRVS